MNSCFFPCEATAGRRMLRATRGADCLRRRQGRLEEGLAMRCRRRADGCRHGDDAAASLEESCRPLELGKMTGRSFVQCWNGAVKPRRERGEEERPVGGPSDAQRPSGLTRWRDQLWKGWKASVRSLRRSRGSMAQERGLEAREEGLGGEGSLTHARRCPRHATDVGPGRPKELRAEEAPEVA